MIAAENLGSSIWCNIRFDSTKFCKFNNLYYIPKFKGHFFFLINEFSVISGVDDLKKLSLSTVQNHSGLYLKLILIKSTHHLLKENFTVANMNSFILKRFKPDNIMHVIHDDLLPLFVTYKELCSGNISLCSSTYQLLLMDSPNDNEPYYEWYKHFSIHTPIILGKLKNPLCIKKGYFGLSNSSIWFQYGFKTTQGPVLESNINGFILAEFSDFIKKQFGLKREINLDHSDFLPILLFSRKLNRKIINEAAMQDSMEYIAESTLKKNFSIINLDLSTNNSTSIINYLHQSQLLVGMHGSAMILAIFMPRGSRIIELFPFGIQPNFVSPLRALCQNKHIYYNYESWVNMNESNTITHPEYPPLHGGILHLEKTKQEEIIKVKTVPAVECCHNPVYLFRMFQDTIVDESFFTIMK
ncbi:protein O-linked-mannose beta-1,4-N-acetylglucosaminyltransferase 2-like [Macrosteles quadrilineatus]|uniref:protein O-linked-mannose beta-1,4-N-acetylglucosaminyltransferase 2-like n=1 Tax=Macrosteles quadrilineatus TaxID=74068 RepID=UPI0023E1DCAA|nr:protein O-linked-mannose beta-1,4-N-acetylglucosaminyltransferase 2-like [Macrosteles quadrilineatus]